MALWNDEGVDLQSRARPTESAFWHGSIASRAKPRDAQRKLGQFMTPPPIAQLIASRMVEGRTWTGRTVRVLDPAAGSGVLSAALIEAIAGMPSRPHRVELVMAEVDETLRPLLERCAQDLRALGRSIGLDVKVQIQWGDFLLGTLGRSATPVVDAVIANPPYFKLQRNDPRALAHEAAVHGQPNIYALFLSACAALLRRDGAFGFITPRSWTNGAYFRATRRVLRQTMSIDALHLFDSRKAHFEADAVLQEALIVWGTGGACAVRHHCLQQSRSRRPRGDHIVGLPTLTGSRHRFRRADRPAEIEVDLALRQRRRDPCRHWPASPHGTGRWLSGPRASAA